MADYNAILDAETDPGAPGKTSLFKRMVANPIAISEGSTDAPVIRAGWHPYNATTVSGGNDGLIYDNAVDGNVVTLVSPDFEDGYEYAFVYSDLRSGAVGDMSVELYLETTAAYANAVDFVSVDGNDFVSGLVEVISPRMVAKSHTVMAKLSKVTTNGASGGAGGGAGGFYHATAQKILRARLTFGNNATDGRIYMLRRLDPATHYA